VVIFPRGGTRAAGSRHPRCRAGNTSQEKQNGFACTDYWKPMEVNPSGVVIGGW